ncbi:choice-of-anchor D domain-containing protein [Simiduia aestuariiviva]|uniref:HYDIN/VesB/CFA65-like Ig-like domain-containing protein n=1 Tax=Simiduia aestuariiviva TaxID=1510459 RepID=A0A839UI74_9GAMM|nr:choice-of-anchor D domain-containing protein [Simiduia aestuariiviva]MBB3167754.1 hypothetical protein [Simiduia aestuariiviva]
MLNANSLRIGLLALFTSTAVTADILFSENFEDGDSAGWNTSGNVAVSGTQSIGNYSLRLKQTASGAHSVNATGYSDVQITMRLAATGLEGSDRCYAEYSLDAGTSWTQMLELADGQDDATFYSASANPAGADDNSNLQVRFRGTGNLLGDYCWGDEVMVTATLGGLTPAPEIELSGSGNFGSVNVGDSDQRQFIISNSGNANLVLGALSSATAPFSVQADNCSGQTLAGAGSCSISVVFSPTSTGYAGDSLSLSNNDADENPLTLALTGTGTEPGTVVDNYDPLSGSGAVVRNELSYAALTGAPANGSLVQMGAFALPAEAAQPVHQFEGSLQLHNESTSGAFDEIKDTFRYTGSGDTTRKHLPEFDYQFVQTGTHLVPVERGTLANSHPEWEYILQPGRVWNENGDNGFSRAAIPFALHQKNANCMHNGVMSLLFKNDGSVSNVAYQISSETCLYFKFDMWGTLAASYTPQVINNADTVKADYQTEVAARLPTKPVAALAQDFPGIDPSQFGSAAETDPAHMTLFGVTYQGVNYVGGCATRAGDYPYCDWLTVPSYSTAKTVFAGTAMMRLEKLYAGASQQMIGDWVADCGATGTWGDVTFEHASDMATGNYGSAGYMTDEGRTHTNDLFLPEDHASKISYSCSYYDRKVAPGTQWVYHTSDTYVLGTAMNAFLKAQAGSNADIFSDVIVNDLWKPLGVSPTAQVSRRTYDAVAQPFAGWGLVFQRDDVAKIANFLNVADGQINGVAMLDNAMFDAAMQRNSADRGPIPLADYHYNNGFWAHEISGDLNCSNPLWVPFMSGYGGISVLLLPNGLSYYYFSDNDTYLWMKAAQEAHKLSPLCQ